MRKQMITVSGKQAEILDRIPARHITGYDPSGFSMMRGSSRYVLAVLASGEIVVAFLPKWERGGKYRESDLMNWV